MDTLPLPPRPSLAQYAKRAKDLVVAARAGDAAVHDWATGWLTSLVRALGVEVTPFVQHSFDRAVESIEARVRNQTVERKGALTLAGAQHLVAAAHGFTSWADFARHVEPARSGGVEVDRFEAAADIVVHGDLEGLRSLITEHPELIRARSTRQHHATLLHYVAANGVEDFRQRTPTNAVAIARLLLEAGAEVDAIADTYGGGSAQTTMNLLVSSTHPADAGMQGALVDVLVDFGAAVNGVADDCSPLLTAIAFGYDDAADALARRGARLDNLLVAAALGRLDLVREMVADKQSLRPGSRIVMPAWKEKPQTESRYIEIALVAACNFGRIDVANHLLELGVDPTTRDDSTPLHGAATTGAMDLVDRLIGLGASLEAENVWGGTVLDAVMFCVRHGFNPQVDYVKVVEGLLARGANAAAVAPFPIGKQPFDDLLARHGAMP